MPTPFTPLPPFAPGKIRRASQVQAILAGPKRSAYAPMLDIGGCALWLAADRLTGLADGDPVAIWPDLSGLGNHVVQATAGSRPVLKLGQAGGFPAVLALNKFMATATTFALTSGSILWVGKVNSANAGASQRIAGLIAGANTFYLSSPNAQNLRVQLTGSTINSGTFPYGVAGIAVVTWDGARLRIWLNGVLVSGAGATVPTPAVFQLGLGNQDAYYSEVAFFPNKALTESERHLIESYLAAKYGIAVR